MKRYSQPTADAVPVPSLGVQDTMSSVRAGENGLRNAALLAQRGVDSSVGVQDATPTLNAIAQHVTPEQTAAQQTPVIDQHGLNHERNWAFCGIASLVSVLQGEGVEIDGSSREGLNALADQIYTPGAGTSGSAMAALMRDKGLDAQFTTNGSVGDLVSSLDAGAAVPMGVVSLSGDVQSLPNGPSTRYADLEEGQSHQKQFGPSGHWVTVVGFEGDVDNPSAYIVNDSDTGAQLKLSPEQLEQSAAAQEGAGIWMVDRKK